MIEIIDIDGNGLIDFEEFLTCMDKRIKNKGSYEELLEDFKFFD